MAEAQACAATTTAGAEDAAAIKASRIARESALVQAEDRAANHAVVDDAAAIRVSRIAGEGALVQAEDRAATICAVAEDAAAIRVRRIAGEGASVEGELDGVSVASSIGINGTSGVVWEEIAGCVSAGEGEALEGDGIVGLDLHDAAELVRIDGEAVGEGRGIDDEVIIDEELSVGKGEGDGFPVEGGVEGDEADRG